MDTLVWLFLVLTSLVSAYMSHKITAIYYKRKLRKVTAANKKSSNLSAGLQ